MLKKIIENTIFIALIIILGISVSPALPFKNIPRTYVVVSGSMEPTIKTGSIVLTKPVNPKEIKVGDIVAFTSPSNSKDVILHRIFGIKSESPLRFSTKGDNNNPPDAWDLMDVGILGKQ
ncbi:signal peptidase I, partial [Candidatus Shapirobacteria bacterium CG_4_9_14_3_um_filter_36_12]